MPLAQYAEMSNDSLLSMKTETQKKNVWFQPLKMQHLTKELNRK